MPHLARGDARLYYEDDGDGPAILMTHGFVASTGMWDGQVTAFRDAYRLVRWDMRGHGRTECPDDPSAYGQDITVVAETVHDLQVSGERVPEPIHR